MVSGKSFYRPGPERCLEANLGDIWRKKYFRQRKQSSKVQKKSLRCGRLGKRVADKSAG